MNLSDLLNGAKFYREGPTMAEQEKLAEACRKAAHTAWIVKHGAWWKEWRREHPPKNFVDECRADPIREAAYADAIREERIALDAADARKHFLRRKRWHLERSWDVPPWTSERREDWDLKPSDKVKRAAALLALSGRRLRTRIRSARAVARRRLRFQLGRPPPELLGRRSRVSRCISHHRTRDARRSTMAVSSVPRPPAPSRRPDDWRYRSAELASQEARERL
jgi:hypothetical protein